MIAHREVLSPLLVVLLVSLLAPAIAEARMYQWVSPGSGSVQLSGQPPPWYRSAQGGPRVQVFDNGNLIDDTAIELPRSQRDELRELAFRESEQRQRAEAVKRLEHAARRKQLQREEIARRELASLERSAEQAASAARREGESADDVLVRDEQLNDDTVARLKAIISEYDRRGGSSAPR